MSPMSVVQNIWDLGSGINYLLLMFVTFGGTMITRIIWEKSFYLTPFRSFRNGDTIFLPTFMAFSAHALGDYERQGMWFETLWWFFLVVIIASVIILLMEGYIPKFPQGNGRSFWIPSQAYHTCMFPLCGYWVVQTILAQLFGTNSWTNTMIAFGFLAGYAGTFIRDIMTGTQHSESSQTN
jgi:hypothetical protein